MGIGSLVYDLVSGIVIPFNESCVLEMAVRGKRWRMAPFFTQRKTRIFACEPNNTEHGTGKLEPCPMLVEGFLDSEPEQGGILCKSRLQCVMSALPESNIDLHLPKIPSSSQH